MKKLKPGKINTGKLTILTGLLLCAIFCVQMFLTVNAGTLIIYDEEPVASNEELESTGTENSEEDKSSSSSNSSEGSSNTGSDEDNSDDDEDDDEILFDCSYNVMAESAYLVNGDTGVVVYEKNPNTPLVSASLVKMMTCILVAENAENLDEETVTAQTWVFNELYGLNASNADIRKGEVLTLRELLYAMILPSGNEAALMAADYISGGYMPNFLYMMNAKAKALGCTNTYFADVNGLSEDNYITAHDAYLILKEFMSIPVLAEIAGQPSYEMAAHDHASPYYISSTNRFLFNNDPYPQKYKKVSEAMLGGKTGGLGEWQNFASMAEYNEQTYYCVVLHSPFEADSVRAAMENPGDRKHRPALVESAELYTWAFNNLSVRATIDIRQPVHEIKVKYSTERDAVRLLPLDNLRTVLPKDKDNSLITMEFDVPESLEAPVSKGEVMGTVTLYLAGTEIGTTELITEQDVSRNEKKYAYTRFREFFKSTFIKTYISLIIICAVIYVLILLYYYNKKRKNKNRHK